jgi:hypothetical protein
MAVQLGLTHLRFYFATPAPLRIHSTAVIWFASGGNPQLARACARSGKTAADMGGVSQTLPSSISRGGNNRFKQKNTGTLEQSR